ncbi:MAG: SH3 domain-containing protein, partial [Xylophilus sp.]|nr:SH3 domain-containing protein [Xylophilus sp.]
MTSKLLVKTLAAALLAVPVLASAQQAFTSQYVNMRAGPAADYPVVTTLPQGTSLMVQGCVNDFTWCDVQLPDSGRGWVSAEYLSYPYQGNNVPVRNWGATIGIPIV